MSGAHTPEMALPVVTDRMVEAGMQTLQEQSLVPDDWPHVLTLLYHAMELARRTEPLSLADHPT